MSKKRSRFRVNDAQTEAIANIKAAAEVVEDAIAEAKKLDTQGARGREFALALTKLEECVMWAKQAVAG